MEVLSQELARSSQAADSIQASQAQVCFPLTRNPPFIPHPSILNPQPLPQTPTVEAGSRELRNTKLQIPNPLPMKQAAASYETLQHEVASAKTAIANLEMQLAKAIEQVWEKQEN